MLLPVTHYNQKPTPIAHAQSSIVLTSYLQQNVEVAKNNIFIYYFLFIYYFIYYIYLYISPYVSSELYLQRFAGVMSQRFVEDIFGTLQ